MAEVVRVDPVDPDVRALARAVAVLKRGGVVAFPTDTVYGIGVDALGDKAIRKIYLLKGRRTRKPLVLFVRDRGELRRYVKGLPKTTEGLFNSYVPGALTLILRASSRAPKELVRKGTIGVRIPDHPLVLKLLERYGGPLATTSANLGEMAPALSANEVDSSLGGKVDLILDGGRSGSAIPSTVLDVSRYPPRLLRKGKIPMLSIEKSMGRKVKVGMGLSLNLLFICTGNLCRSPLAKGILESLLPRTLSRRVRIESAGTAALDGSPAGRFAVEVALERGADLSSHRSRMVSEKLLSEADLILVMEPAQIDRLALLLPEAREKAHLLKAIGRRRVTREGDTVEDPVGGGRETYEKCAEEIESSLRWVIQWLRERVG